MPEAVADWLGQVAGRTPHRVAVRAGTRDWTYAQLAAEANRLASALAASGAGRSSCVTLLDLNGPAAIALLFACARVGALFMPLNWRLAVPEQQQMLADCPPDLLFVGERFLAQGAGLAAAQPGPTPVALAGTPPAGWLRYGDFLARAVGAPPIDPDVGPETPLLICYTSGSTATPKGVLLSQQALAANADHSVQLHAMTPQDVVLTTLPLFHVGGLNNQTTPALRSGATVVLHPKFDADATFDAIERERVTLTVLVPAQLTVMMAHPRWAQADLASLRMITTGSTIVPQHVIRAVHERGIPLVQIYGSTETSPIAACLRPEDARRKAGSTGRAAAHCELRIVDEADREVAQGQPGEILVRGPNVMLGYWRRPEASAKALAGGWFHSGDIGHLDADGCLWVDGRKTDMIISGGENIAPAEIENLLLESGCVAEASVVGVPDPRWGERVVAVVAAREPGALNAAGVLALLDGRLARYKHPKQVLLVPELPKTALGKVRKEAVRQLVAARAAELVMPQTTAGATP
ncbi:MAG: class I adenylate-forming enzyme family protein [Ramlibacter sp.]